MSKECRICHRIGTRSFAPEGDYGWVCERDDICLRRAHLNWCMTHQAQMMAGTETSPFRDDRGYLRRPISVSTPKDADA